MKIMLVLPTVQNNGQAIEMAWTNIYHPLVAMGHQVSAYDTKRSPISFEEKLKTSTPEVLLCMITGEGDEPLEQIGGCNIPAINFFCDDVWRFETWSRKVCKHFTKVLTSEPSFVQEYASLGIECRLFPWFSHTDAYQLPIGRDQDLFFSSTYRNAQRTEYEQVAGRFAKSKYLFGTSFENMIIGMNQSKIVLNLSRSQNGKTQIKARPFEAMTAGALSLSEYHPGLEHFFEKDKEIVFFESPEEFYQKAQYLLSNRGEKARLKIAERGHLKATNLFNSRRVLSEILTWAIA